MKASKPGSAPAADQPAAFEGGTIVSNFARRAVARLVRNDGSGAGALRARIFPVLSVPRGERDHREGSGCRDWTQSGRARAGYGGLPRCLRTVSTATRRVARSIRATARANGSAGRCRGRGLSVCSVPPKGGRKHPEQNLVQIDTRNILFICGGAFVGLDTTISNRLSVQTLGFNSRPTSQIAENTNLFKFIQPSDLRKYGLIPEIIGRLPVITHLNPLDKATLKRILTEPKNSIIRQYQKMFELENKTLEFDDAVLDMIVDKADELQLGARGLRSILEAIMLDIMFDMPDSDNESYVIGLDWAQRKLEASLIDFRAAS